MLGPTEASTAFGQPMIYAEVAVTVRRPRHDVALVMFNPRFDSAWIGGVSRARPSPPGPLQRGTKVARERRFLGRRVADSCEVIEHVPDRCVEMVTQSPFALRIRYELEGIPEGTIARIRAEGNTTSRLRFAVPAINRLLRFQVIRDLSRLKSLLESGAWRRVPSR